MDGTGKLLDDPDTGGAVMQQVPTYTLYGERAPQGDAGFLHCETIPARSRLHGFRIRPHRHAHLFQLLLLSGGSGTVAFDGQSEALHPASLVLLPPGVVHGFAFSDDVAGMVVTLYERQLAPLVQASPDLAPLFATPRVLRLAADSAAALGAALGSLAAEFAADAPSRAAMLQAQLAVACVAAHRAWLAQSDGAAPQQRRGAGLVRQFRALVEAGFRHEHPIEHYAVRLGITATHLRRLCRQHLGATPLGAVTDRRLLEAKRLLAFTTLTVKQVAAELGFDDQAYFARVFQRNAGLAPTAYRATQGQAAKEGSAAAVALRRNAPGD